ncbi:glycosyltransferase [Luteococcus japonicus]|uniref:Glycosyltransferase n=1 Tax=Luteococcus japonicus LSP_Lj1 TaxID=1255658 RepID=A0A1R4IKH6_9ACTN|nr:glycosyltransferase [Luteococcus japonicus]SJN20412.1 Glycosyltransferase [Luteococcus japonicus LSP_Lj1]
MGTEGHALLLFTNVYPFDKGEEFLENEIDALAEAFDKVVVIACQTGPDAKLTRRLPEGVMALHVDGRRPTGRKQAALTTAKGMGHLAGGRFAEMDRPKDPRHVVMDAQFEGRARSAYAQLAPQFDRMGLGQLEEVTLCAYWLHIPARVAILVAEQLPQLYPLLRISQLISRTHRYDLYEEAAPMGHIPLRAALLGRFDAVHPVSDDGTEYLRRRYPAHAGKVSTRRLGTPDPGERVQTSRQPFHVVSCSFTLPVKRLDRFAPALKLVQDAGFDVLWTHYGSGDELDGLRAQAESLLGKEHVVMPGYVRNTDLAGFYREQHPSLFMNLSASEGLPVSIMEATALGLPVVATDVGGVREIVHEGRNGALLPADFTDQQAADALLAVARMDDQAYAQLCDAARTVWEENFSKDRVYPAFAAELREG